MAFDQTYFVPEADSKSTPVLFVPLQPTNTTGDQLDAVLKIVKMLDICTGYLSTPGSEKLATWPDVMDSDERFRLLFGMAPESWKDWRTTPKAAATFLACH